MAPERPLLVEDFQTVPIAIWRELRAPFEWIRLWFTRAYWGRGVPRGHGEPVVVVPGILCHDVYLVELHGWLRRMGYRPYFSGIGVNADCPNVLVDKLHATIERAHADTGQKVHLIGHSLGGILSRGAATLFPDAVASVTTLGSPYRGVSVHAWIHGLSRILHWRILRRRRSTPPHDPISENCFSTSCECRFARHWRGAFPDGIPELAIYTKQDGIVDWEMCLNGEAATDFEVGGTHCGLPWNAEVLRAIAERLADYAKTETRDTA